MKKDYIEPLEQDVIEVSPVAYFRSPFGSQFGIPRQSGIIDELEGTVVFVKDFRRVEALKGIEGFDRLWLIWGFSVNSGKWKMTVRPPRLGGNESVGVFASRSPFRPNGLGLSCVQFAGLDLEAKDGPLIKVRGADLMDGTPIYDIKPYVGYSDCFPDASSGFVDENEWNEADVIFPPELQSRFLGLAGLAASDADTKHKALEALRKVLSQRPVPQYINNPDRVYGFPFMGCDIRFKVDARVVTVVDITTC